MPTFVRCRNLRNIFNLNARVHCAAAKVDIRKPDGTEAFIQAAELLPHIPPDHKKCSGKLLDGTRLIERPVQIPIASVDRIPWKQTVQPQQLETQSERRRKAPNRKSGLRSAIGPDQSPRSDRVLNEWIDWGEECYIRIQQKDEFRVRSANTLIHGSGKSKIFGVRDQPGAGRVDSGNGLIRRRVVDHHRRPGRSHFSERLQAGFDDLRRVVGNNYRGASQK